MKSDTELEIEVVKIFRAQAQVAQRSPNPRRTIIAARWQIFFDDKIAELEKQVQPELRLPVASAALKREETELQHAQ